MGHGDRRRVRLASAGTYLFFRLGRLLEAEEGPRQRCRPVVRRQPLCVRQATAAGLCRSVLDTVMDAGIELAQLQMPRC